MSRFHVAVGALVTLLVTLSVTGCRGAADPPSAAPRFDGPGPDAVAVDTVELSEPVGPVTLWRPTGPLPDTDGAADPPPGTTDGPTPLLVFAHGAGLEPADYEPLLRHVASWGVVVAAPERGRDLDLRAVATALHSVEVAGAGAGAGAATEAVGALLADDVPLVVGGHSRGTAEASTATLDADVAGAFLLAGGGVTDAVADASSPLLFVAGGNDDSTDSWIRPNVAGAAGPHELLVVTDAGHLSFTGICDDPQGASLRVGDCATSGVDERSVQPVLRHSVVAFVRWRSGLDDRPRSLDADVLTTFDTPVTVEGGFDDI